MTILEALREEIERTRTTVRFVNLLSLLEAGFAPDDDYEESLREYEKQEAR